ncbi:MAG: glycosyltransferase 87 family protein [Actinomycetota bacterium]|nr:glycosyltransferase 87 family protein [Actinomycetota bacterium]
MLGVVLAVWRRLCALPAVVQDAWLYVASAVFAGATAFVAVSSDYRTWGEMAAAAYGAAALVCFGVARAVARSTGRDPVRAARFASVSRRVVVVAVIAGAVLVPLVFQLVWRAEGLPGQHAQPEVAVVERAGDRAAASHDPYLTHPTTVGNAPRSDAKHVDANSFFPYLPGMVPFGLVNAVKLPPELQDARVALTGFTLVVGAVALLWSDASLARRGRALQFLVVLPSGALPMVTGGDDLPVLALMLLGLVLAERRRPVLAGIALGLSGTLKFTAWPMLLLMVLAVRDREGRPAPFRYGLALLLVVTPVLGLGVALDPTSFFDNVVRFPLGLAKVRSPAASPMVGQVLTHLLPQHRLAVTALLVLVGAAVVAAAFLRHRPRTPAGVARFTGFAMALATVLAPATRFGYFIYPANLFVWAYVLDGMSAARRSGGQSASSISNTVSDTVLVGVAPPSAGVMEAATGRTTTAASQ